MEFLITESQLELILKEAKGNENFSSDLKKLKSFTNNLVARVMRAYEINIKMLLTWGTSIGGFVMPLDNFIKTGNFDLSEDEIALILAGVAFTVFYETKRGLSSIMKKIRENDLEESFLIVLDKGVELKQSFYKFLSVARVTSSTLLETVAYAFLIPIVPDIQSLAHSNNDHKQVILFIVERIIASGVILLSKEVLTSVITKIMKKFQ